MDLTILLGSGGLDRYSYSLQETNPGIGGTQFTSIQLALRLAERYPNWTVRLVSDSKVALRTPAKNITTTVADDLSEYLAATPPEPGNVLLASVRTMFRLDPAVVQRHAGGLVAWSRHPEDRQLRRLDWGAPLGAAVSVGHFQFHTNAWIRAPHFYIRNLFQPPMAQPPHPRSLADEPGPLRLVHLGALVEEKGFLYIARQWPKLKQHFGDVTLDVIGGGDLYGGSRVADYIPAEPNFARRISESIPLEDVESGRVTFHGTLGTQKFDVLERSTAALLNPTGRTEAFPASPLECMWVGLPVIASANLGMWDSMRFFPELQLAKPDNAVDRLDPLLEVPGRYQALSQRSMQISRRFADETDDILTRWQQLLEAVARRDAKGLKLDVPRPRPRSAIHFGYRIVKRNARPYLSTTPLGRAWKSLREKA